LVPSDPFEQAHLDQWLFWWSTHLEPALDRLVYERRVKPLFLGLPDVDPSIVAEAEAALERFLPVLDRHCDITGRPQPLPQHHGLAGGYASKVVLEGHIEAGAQLALCPPLEGLALEGLASLLLGGPAMLLD
jgi:hypothetical protein